MIGKIFKTAVLAAAFMPAVSCSEMVEPEGAGEVHDRDMERIPVTVSIPSMGTKVTNVSNEDRINSLQVFVFRPDGTLDAYASGNLSELVLDCTAGNREFVAVVNAPDISRISLKSQLQAAVSRLDDNSPGSFVMSGSSSIDVSEAEKEVEISVARLVARISVKKVTNALSAPAYAGTDIRVTGIYLSNVAGDRPYLSTGTPSLWLNCLGTKADVPSLLYSGRLSYSISNGKSYAAAHYFYCYPNAVAEDTVDSSWSPRFTRIVIETQIAGKTYYYHASIANIESNHLYEIENVQITRLGSPSPEQPVEAGSVSVTVSVADWEEGTVTPVAV